MIKVLIKYSLLILIPFTIVCSLYANNYDTRITNKLVYIFEINDEINPAASRTAIKAIQEAEKQNADYILLDLNTYGGLLQDADLIRTALLQTKISTLVYIRNNAASSGALISIACDSIYMNEGATIGAAAVVYTDGTMAPEKYQSFMRNKMRATAEATNRNPTIAEAMVDPRIAIDSLTKQDEILSFSVNQAIKNHYCQSKELSIEQLLKKSYLQDYHLKYHKVSVLEKIISFFIHPFVSGLLLIMIVLGLLFELKSPGVGFPLALAFIAAIFYFIPHYIEGLAANWEIILFLFGVLLLALEIFIIPGFGLAGIAGISATVFGLGLSLIRNLDGFEFGFIAVNEIIISSLTIAFIFIFSIFVLFFIGDDILNMLFTNSKLGLKIELNKKDGFAISEIDNLSTFLDLEGISHTDLRPSGKIIVNNKWLNALSDGAFISKGEKIRIVKIKNNNLIVEKIN